MSDDPVTRKTPAPIYIVTGGTGFSGEQLVHTTLAQFPDCGVPVTLSARITHEQELEDVVTIAAQTGGTIVHTMVDSKLRGRLLQLAAQWRVVEIDLMGPLLDRISSQLHQQPVEMPGLYHELHQAYFNRVSAIDFALKTDDGQNSEMWPGAEVVLLGVSRVGKTPLSMFLAVMGWKVCNVPLIPGLPLPDTLKELDRRRIVGLTINARRLLEFRRRRFESHPHLLGDYLDNRRVREEILHVDQLMRRAGLHVIDVTLRPLENTAGEITRLITGRLGADAYIR